MKTILVIITLLAVAGCACNKTHVQNPRRSWTYEKIRISPLTWVKGCHVTVKDSQVEVSSGAFYAVHMVAIEGMRSHLPLLLLPDKGKESIIGVGIKVILGHKDVVQSKRIEFSTGGILHGSRLYLSLAHVKVYRDRLGGIHVLDVEDMRGFR